MIRAFALLIVVGALSAAGAWGFAVYSVKQPVGTDTALVVEVQHGARLRPVLFELHRAHLIRHPYWTYLWARVTGHTRVTSGTYKLSAKQSPVELLAMLAEGRVSLERVTIAEGLNRWQVRDLLVAQGWMTKLQFDTLCDDAALLKQHKVPGPTCEGYLYPETYTFARGVSPRDMFGNMYDAYRQQVQRAMARSQAPMALDERQFATLASIVEKETGAPKERPRIACVFYNRMRATPPWRLETDPTVIYAATLADPKFDGNIKRYHLHELDSPYNTYRVVGLPPGPIANPGAGALDAVAQPMACPDFFFVSKNHGEHVFCPTLKCHTRAVKTWQIDYFKKNKAKAAPSSHPSIAPKAADAGTDPGGEVLSPSSGTRGRAARRERARH